MKDLEVRIASIFLNVRAGAQRAPTRPAAILRPSPRAHGRIVRSVRRSKLRWSSPCVRAVRLVGVSKQRQGTFEASGLERFHAKIVESPSFPLLLPPKRACVPRTNPEVTASATDAVETKVQTKPTQRHPVIIPGPASPEIRARHS